MYKTFYGFRERPFSLLPDPQYLFESRQHQAALSRLLLAVENRSGISVLTGAPGTGKTTLLRELMRHLPDSVTVGLITNTHESFTELLHWILAALLIPCNQGGRAERIAALRAFLVSERAKGQRVLLILDEAQNLSADAIEELRMLSDIGADGTPAFHLILAGQSELAARLSRSEFGSFTQRVAFNDEIGTLGAEDTAAYIHHRTRIAGAARQIFDERACAAIHRNTQGNPRLINLLCDLCLVYGYARGAEQISAAIVENVLRERAQNGSIPEFRDTVVLAGTDNTPQQAPLRESDTGTPPAARIAAAGPVRVQSRPHRPGKSAKTMKPASTSPSRAEPALRAKRPDALLDPRKLSLNEVVIGAFVAGLVAAGLVAGILYYAGSGDGDRAPEAGTAHQPRAPLTATPAGSDAAGQSLAEVERLKSEMLERERDAALAKARALERERDAAIAAARATTQSRIAKSQAERARLEKERATELTVRAQEETARALEQLRASQEQAAQAAARERAAAERTMRALEQTPPAVPAPPAPTAPAPPVVAEPSPAPPATANTDGATGFSANPCKGPSARFLSTCRDK